MSIQKTRQFQTDDSNVPEVIWPSRDEARRMFDEIARNTVGMSGDAFLQRLDAGEYADMPDDWEHMPFIELAMMSSFGR
jgi:hypothetical protein